MRNHLEDLSIEEERRQFEEFAKDQAKVIQGRKLIGEFLFYIACQTLSSSLAILMFQYTIKLWVLTWVCYLIGLAPSLPELCEIHIGKNEQNGNTEITIMQSPGKFLFKLVFSIGFTYVGISTVRDATKKTYEGLLQFYEQVRVYETPKTVHYQFPVEPTILLIATALIGVFLFYRGKLPHD